MISVWCLRQFPCAFQLFPLTISKLFSIQGLSRPSAAGTKALKIGRVSCRYPHDNADRLPKMSRSLSKFYAGLKSRRWHFAYFRRHGPEEAGNSNKECDRNISRTCTKLLNECRFINFGVSSRRITHSTTLSLGKKRLPCWKYVYLANVYGNCWRKCPIWMDFTDR